MQNFQDAVHDWVMSSFGHLPIIDAWTKDEHVRGARFAEEAIELAQACGISQQGMHTLIDYVYGRPVGEPKQEVGGVAMTLAVLCSAKNIRFSDAAWDELNRCKQPEIIAKIIRKQMGAAPGSVLPGSDR